jgi:hypothetical protein
MSLNEQQHKYVRGGKEGGGEDTISVSVLFLKISTRRIIKQLYMNR